MPQVVGQWFLEQFPPKQHRRTLFIVQLVLEYDFSQNNTVERKNVVAKFLVFSPHITQFNSTQSL